MKYLRLFLFFLGLLLPAAGWAQAPLLLSAGAGQLSGSGHFTWLRDPSGQLGPEAAFASAAWRDLPGMVRAGYTADAVWLRLEVNRQPEAPNEWMLSFTNALLDDVRLYRPDGAGGWTAQYSGEDVGRSHWKVDSHRVALPVRLDAAGPETWLIRLQSKNAMSTGIDVWPQAVFHDYTRREALYYGLYFGCYLLLILFHAFFWHMTREPQSGWYLLYVSMAAAIELLTVAIPQQLFDLSVGLSDPLLGVVMSFSLTVGVRFSSAQLGLAAHWPRLSRTILQLAIATSITSALLVVSGHYGLGAQLIQPMSMGMILLFVGLALYLLRRGDPAARFFLLVFGIYYAGVIVSYLRNLAFLPPNGWTNNAAAVGTMLHMILMSLRLNSRYDGLRREKAAAQAEALQAMNLLNENLEREVDKRTTALVQEISRRKVLEQELRDALEVEKRTNEEQHDFVAMVSHEFRTPLAIINTTAQLIAKNLNAPRDKTLTRCQNLRNATQRMSTLVDEYLTSDLMETGSTPFRPRRFDLPALLDDILKEWPATRVRLALGQIPSRFVGDASLLRVAVRNLLANADRHAPPDSQVTLQVEGQPDGSLRLVVNNSGKPIPAEEVPRLFQKYFRGRLAQHRPGAGLGLYLVRRIAQMHGGEIALEERGDNGGITFAITLPGRQGATPITGTAPAGEPAVS